MLKVLAGVGATGTVKVKVTAHARRFEGMTIALVIDPDLKMYVPGQSWWTQPEADTACVPAELVKTAAYKEFVAKSFELQDMRCARL